MKLIVLIAATLYVAGMVVRDHRRQQAVELTRKLIERVQ